MLRDSVLDCLVDLGLTSFLAELGNVPELLTELSSNSEDDDTASYTLFAPTNEAFSALSDLERGSSRMILGGHIVNRTIFSSRFRTGQILTPFDDQYALHVSTVSSGSGRVSFQEVFVLLNLYSISPYNCRKFISMEQMLLRQMPVRLGMELFMVWDQ